MKPRIIVGVVLILLFSSAIIIGTYLMSKNPYPGIYYGTEAPVSRALAGVANNGDFYINVQNYTVYQYVNESWIETSNVPPNTDTSFYGLYIDLFAVGFAGALIVTVIAWGRKE